MSITDTHPGVEKELKVRIPAPMHIKLHTIKVLHGQTISATVKAALGAYFATTDLGSTEEDPRQRRLESWAGEEISTRR